MSARLFGGVAAIALLVAPLAAFAQTATYRLHNEASTTAGFKQLRTTGPDAAAVVLQTVNLQSTAAGEKKIAEFDTASGVPGTAGKIPSGATITAQVWMRKTAALGVMTPRVRVRLNNATGTTLCTATGTTALTTTLTLYTLTCATTANITLTATSRLYVWAGVNLTTTSSSGAFRGELGVEGVSGGSYDSQVTVPTALGAPSISSVAPSSGAIGASVTIAGTNFRDQQLGSVVRFFNNRTATVTSWSNTAIVATVPTSTTTGAVTVTVAGTASNGSTFTIAPPPSIGSLAPSTGMAGTLVTITGSNFGATQGASSVRFNGVSAAVTSWSATQIVAAVPATATSGNVVVTVSGAGSNGVAFTVAAAAPTLSPGSGTYAAGQLVTITSPTSGATIYYTVNGQDPTAADSPLANGGTVPVGTYTLKARAFANGLGQSAVTTAVYQRDSSACTYVVRPGALSLGGVGSLGQLTVTPSSDYCDWTATSSQPWLTLGAASGTGPGSLSVLVAANNSGAVRNATITIGSTVVPVVQNVVSTCAFGVTPSAVAAGPAANGGTLTVTASDPACAWVAASDVPWLTLGATAGVGNSSLVYSLTENTGSAARWSGLTVGTQQVSVTQASSTALTIAGGTAPAANALGWHQQDVTVVFTCAGPGTITCADPVTVTDDGVHDITGLASNDLLDTASATVTVRIDRVAPSLGVSFPRANSLVQAGAVTITGSVADALSTPSVVCDGVLAAVTGGSFACAVTVGSGTTNVNVTAVDQAGNSRSQVVAISTTDAIVTPPTNLRVSPQNVTMVVGERRRFAMLDDLDRAPVDVGWTRTNTTLSTLLVTQGVAELTATAVGSTVLTATWRGLTATTTVSIVTASAVVAGTTIWNAPPRSVGATVANVMKGAATPSGESYLYAVERGAVDTVRVFDVDGAERWSIGTTGQVTQLSGDSLGGAVALVGSTLTRLEPGGAAMSFATEVASPGFAIHPDGPLYYVHWTGSGYRLRGDDVGLGGGRFWDLPAEASSVGTPTVMPDGSIALPYSGPSFRLLIARPDGSTSTHELFSGPQQPSVIPYKAIPNGQGGYFVAYDDWGFNVNYYAASIVTVDGNGVPQTYATVGGTQHAFNSGTWFGWGGGRSHGTLVMGPSSPGGPDILNVTYNAVHNGQWGVGVTDVTASGFPISDFWLPGVVQPTYLSSDQGFVVGFPTGPMGGPSPDYDLMTLTSPRPSLGGAWIGGTVNGLTEMLGPVFSPAVVPWGYQGGDRQGTNSSRVPRWAHFLPATEPVVLSEYRALFDDRSRYQQFQFVRGRHDDFTSVNGRATAWAFLESASDGLDALAFVGHAVTITEGGIGSVGLRFIDKAIVRLGFTAPPQEALSFDTLSANARVVFIASCQIGEEFRRLWEYRNLPGRALIYPELLPPASASGVGNIDLVLGAKAWNELTKVLGMGSSVSEAVAHVNTQIPLWYPNQNLPNTSPPKPDPRHYTRFAVEGPTGGTDVWVDKRQ